MTTSFRLPDLGEGVHEAEILAIPVSAGQEVKEGDVILEIETDKAAVEIPSPVSGTIEEIRVKVGDMAEVGEVLIVFDDGIKEQRTKSPAAGRENHPPEGDRKQPPVPASPSTRKLARELEIDLREVTPTGSGGIVTREDVEKHAKKAGAEVRPDQETEPPAKPAKPAKPAAPAGRAGLPDFTRWGEVERVPFRSIRRATATQMTSSWSQIPHVHSQDQVDITRLEAFRRKHKKEIEAVGGRLTMTVFGIKAVAAALKNFPYFNASLDLDAQEIVLKRYFNIGIAVDTDQGLMVPVIRDVDRKSIKELAIEVNQTIDRVRSGRHSREDMVGGTFTITNAGALGGHQFSAIINHPEVAILGFGQGRMQPAVVTDERGRQEIAPRLIMPIVLCFDHRVVDGADAIRFLRVVIDALEDPDELLITMV